MLNKNALIIGNSDGIGLGLTRELLNQGWQVKGVSRSLSPIRDSDYSHVVAQVQDVDFDDNLRSTLKEMSSIDICVYCVGIGELLNLENMSEEIKIVDVNFLSMIKSASIIIPHMVRAGKGHFIGLSSVADAMLSEEAPSYHASKAGFSNYLESLALSTRSHGVFVSNVRFGFVDTKMAKGDVKPFMMTVDDAVLHIFKCMETKQVRMTRPRIVSPLIAFRNRMLRLKNFRMVNM